MTETLAETPGFLALLKGSLIAAIAAAVAATATVGILSGPAVWVFLIFSPVILALAAVYAMGHAMLLGLPLAFLFVRRWRVSGWNASLCGVVVGGLPVALMLYIANPGGFRGGDPATMEIMAFFGVMGAIGGLFFYLQLAGKLRGYGL